MFWGDIFLYPSLEKSLKRRGNLWLEKGVDSRARRKKECRQQNKAQKSGPEK